MKFFFLISSTLLILSIFGCAKNTSITATNQTLSTEDIEYEQIESKTINIEHSLNKMNKISEVQYILTE